jgi:hypothetical protein
MARTIHATGLADNMNNLQIGKMYLVKEWFWLLFPTKKVAGEAVDPEADEAADNSLVEARRDAKWISKDYNCNVVVVEENTCFVLLEQDEVYFKVLDSNGNIGWIYCSDFSCYFKIVKE